MRSWPVLVATLLGACHVSADYSGTRYECPDGVCPSGFQCVAGRCVMGQPGDGPLPDVSVPDAPPPPLSWWDASFTRRARLSITDAAAQPLGQGFPIGAIVELSTLDAPGAASDDLRVAYLDPQTQTWTELTRYLELAGPTYDAWFKLQAPLAAGASTFDYWLYFGNAAPTSAPSNGSQVFDFYDGFGGSAVDTGKWTVQGAPSEASNNLVLHTGDSVRSNVQFPPGYAMEASMIAPAASPRFWIGWQRQTDFDDSPPWLIWINRDPSDSDFPPGGTAGTIWGEVNDPAAGPTAIAYGGAKPIDAAKHWYTVQRLADRIVFKYEEAVVSQIPLPGQDTQKLQIRLSNESTGKELTLGAAHIRQAVWPDPIVTIGATETHP